MVKSEFHVVIKYCFLIGKDTVKAKQWLDKCNLDSAPLETMVKRWCADFKHVMQPQIMLMAQNAQIWQLSCKTPKNSNSFWPILN